MGREGMGTNLCTDGWGWGQTFVGTGRDGDKPLSGRVGMGTNLSGMGTNLCRDG